MVVGAAAIASGPLGAAPAMVAVDGGAAAIRAALGVERPPYPVDRMAGADLMAAVGLVAEAGITDPKVAYSQTIPQDECPSPELTG